MSLEDVFNFTSRHILEISRDHLALPQCLLDLRGYARVSVLANLELAALLKKVKLLLHVHHDQILGLHLEVATILVISDVPLQGVLFLLETRFLHVYNHFVTLEHMRGRCVVLLRLHGQVVAVIVVAELKTLPPQSLHFKVTFQLKLE